MSVEVPPGYKQTEVGVIPEDWGVKSLENLSVVVTGNTPPTQDAKNYGNDYMFVSPADINRSKYIKNTEKMISEKGFRLSRQLPKNSILFVCIGSTIGKCGMASKELTANQQINAVLPSSNYSSDYLYYALSVVASRVKALAGQQAVPIVNKAQFVKTLIPFPLTKLEQQAIAEALGDADALIEGLESLVAKKRQLKQGAMQELLTGDKRLPGFFNEWSEVRLGELFDFKNGLNKAKAFFGFGIPIVNYMDVYGSSKIYCSNLKGRVSLTAQETKNFNVIKGDVFFTKLFQPLVRS